MPEDFYRLMRALTPDRLLLFGVVLGMVALLLEWLLRPRRTPAPASTVAAPVANHTPADEPEPRRRRRLPRRPIVFVQRIIVTPAPAPATAAPITVTNNPETKMRVELHTHAAPPQSYPASDRPVKVSVDVPVYVDVAGSTVNVDGRTVTTEKIGPGDPKPPPRDPAEDAFLIGAPCGVIPVDDGAGRPPLVTS